MFLVLVSIIIDIKYLTSFEKKEEEKKKTLIWLAMASTVVVFDFDLTILDVDSDIWVVDQFGAPDRFNGLIAAMPWNSVMDIMMDELHSQGKSIEEISECLRRAPLDPHIKSAIKTAHALGCDLRVVSDANLFFIETILKHHGILGCFTEINTNPCCVDEQGRLRIFPFHDFSHGCCLCPANMCKGKIIERIQASASAEGKTQIIYVGDGKGDYCPSLRLSEGDYAMPRKNFPVWDLIHSDIGLIKAGIHEWSNGEEMERVLLQHIELPLGAERGDSAQPSPEDCKVQLIPKASSVSTFA